jgi:hypothetical protein
MCRVATLRSAKCVQICVQLESHGVLQLTSHRELVYLTLSLLAHALYNSTILSQQYSVVYSVLVAAAVRVIKETRY